MTRKLLLIIKIIIKERVYYKYLPVTSVVNVRRSFLMFDHFIDWVLKYFKPQPEMGFYETVKNYLLNFDRNQYTM